jgi:hypothetical protein
LSCNLPNIIAQHVHDDCKSIYWTLDALFDLRSTYAAYKKVVENTMTAKDPIIPWLGKHPMLNHFHTTLLIQCIPPHPAPLRQELCAARSMHSEVSEEGIRLLNISKFRIWVRAIKGEFCILSVVVFLTKLLWVILVLETSLASYRGVPPEEKLQAWISKQIEHAKADSRNLENRR